jgi:hypothetical protein
LQVTVKEKGMIMVVFILWQWLYFIVFLFKNILK